MNGGCSVNLWKVRRVRENRRLHSFFHHFCTYMMRVHHKGNSEQQAAAAAKF
jgi:hypothetical protein